MIPRVRLCNDKQVDLRSYPRQPSVLLKNSAAGLSVSAGSVANASEALNMMISCMGMVVMYRGWSKEVVEVNRERSGTKVALEMTTAFIDERVHQSEGGAM